MKKHAIIPVFIPHLGCPNDCVFCNQKIITARQQQVSEEDVRKTISQYLSTLQENRPETLELAFFGGSFTGLPMEEQNRYLDIALEYKAAGIIDKIHMSTRPDYIDEAILDNLAAHEVDVIELGVQSFDPAVLEASNRGHSAEDIYKACRLIKDRGFTLGIQLMIGLPKDSRESCIFSAKEAVRIGPSIARLYPTVVINDTELENMMHRGEYRPLAQEEAVSITKDMYRILDRAGINIIRVGLKSTDLVSENGLIEGRTYHPAFRQLVEGEIAREDLQTQLEVLLAKDSPAQPETLTAEDPAHPETLPAEDPAHPKMLTFLCSPASFNNMIGHKACNRKFFAAAYPGIDINYTTSDTVEDGRYYVLV